MRYPKAFSEPLAVGAPDPGTKLDPRPARSILFFDPSNEKMTRRALGLAGEADVILCNLEDGIKQENKDAARRGMVRVSHEQIDRAQLWTRVNSLDSPWVIDDLFAAVLEANERLDVIMVPKVEGPEDIYYLDRLLAQLEARVGRSRPLRLHAILETARGVSRVEEICSASPRIEGLSLGPADLAANRRMKTTRVGGGHPGYLVRADHKSDASSEARPTYQQDLWHYTIARMVDACVAADVNPYYGPFGDIRDQLACEDQFRNAFLLGCVGAWALHPTQVAIARRVFSPDPVDVRHAVAVLEAMGDGHGAVMLDGKMEDDASVKQYRVIVELARSLATNEPDLAVAYGFTEFPGGGSD